jgi:hypothetical protein
MIGIGDRWTSFFVRLILFSFELRGHNERQEQRTEGEPSTGRTTAKRVVCEQLSGNIRQVCAI